MTADPVRIDWSFYTKDAYHAGTVTFDRRAWNAMTPEGRRVSTKVRVGNAVLAALDVDWAPTNASYDNEGS